MLAHYSRAPLKEKVKRGTKEEKEKLLFDMVCLPSGLGSV